MTPSEKRRNAGIWFATLIAATAFLGAAASKLTGNPQMTADFAHWGYPEWFMYVVGAGELLGAALLLVPRTSTYGGALLAALMASAVVTHVRFSEWSVILAPLILGLSAAGVAWARLPAAIGPIQRPAAPTA